MILNLRCLQHTHLLISCLLIGSVLPHGIQAADLPSGSGVVTADFSVEKQAVEERPGRVQQAEHNQSFGTCSDSILKVAASRDEDSNFTKGTSSSKVRKQAIDKLPLRHLTEDQKRRVMNVVNDTGFYRRLPTVVFPAESECYTYFLDYPESAVSIWRAMGISEMRMGQTAPNFYTGDVGDGTTGLLEVVYRDSDMILVFCDGEYKSPFLKQPIKSQSILLLETNYFRETDDKVYVTHRADLFVTFPSETVETIAKVLAPMTAPIADRSFVEVSMFLKMMSIAMERRPDWVGDMVDRMQDVPEDRKVKLLAVSEQINSRAESRINLSNHRTAPSSRLPRQTAAPIPATQPVARPAQPERASQPGFFRR